MEPKMFLTNPKFEGKLKVYISKGIEEIKNSQKSPQKFSKSKQERNKNLLIFPILPRLDINVYS